MESHEVETVVIGAGVVGLACAARLAVAGREVLVLERNGAFGEETSARNSEVIHAGIYYPPGSLKALLCVRGKAMVYQYCAERGIASRRLGKLVVAADQDERRAVLQLLERGKRNGVDDLAWLDQDSMRALEPALVGVGAMHSPSTGIVDSHGLMLSLLGDLENSGGALSVFSTVRSILSADNRFELEVETADGRIRIISRELLNCAGPQAVQIAESDPSSHHLQLPAAFYTKGNYFRVSGQVPFEHLIYPAPVPGGLGVHLTRDLNGNARFGPDVEPVSNADASLAVDQSRAAAFYESIRRYWPALPDNALLADYAGIRPKIRWPDESSQNGNADFAI
ncbi:MAG: NAD(P)/FAD-dependent oxidoreductase, partial [Gammaproteobacteria bacterium]|nr:NAD(P)/FAD-dependent oxidoreductase [Gammaproteobacteria bacterium]